MKHPEGQCLFKIYCDKRLLGELDIAIRKIKEGNNNFGRGIHQEESIKSHLQGDFKNNVLFKIATFIHHPFVQKMSILAQKVERRHYEEEWRKNSTARFID